MRSFKINENIEIVCEWKKTRMAFKHEASLLIDGIEVDKTKICYQNRTWESYGFQSVMKKLIEKTKALNPEEKKICNEWLNGDRTYWSEFKQIGDIAKLGEIFCDTKEAKNDWKARMLKAGLENKGLQMSEDWDSLNEDEKERRLDLVINEVSKVGESK